jgi:GGDEF domain-containing protein
VRELVRVAGLAIELRGPVPVAVRETAACLGALRALHGEPVATLVADIVAISAAARAVGLPVDDTQPVLDVALRAGVEGHLAAAIPPPLGTTRDPLSGLLDAAAFLEAADRVIAAGERSEPPALIVVSPVLPAPIDDRLAADLAVVRFTAALRRCARTDDVLGRLDGGTFVALVPACSATRGRHIARRIVIRCAPWSPKVGVGWLEQPESARFLLAAAESALARADDDDPLVVSARDDLVEAEVVGP